MYNECCSAIVVKWTRMRHFLTLLRQQEHEKDAYGIYNVWRSIYPVGKLRVWSHLNNIFNRVYRAFWRSQRGQTYSVFQQAMTKECFHTLDWAFPQLYWKEFLSKLVIFVGVMEENRCFSERHSLSKILAPGQFMTCFSFATWSGMNGPPRGSGGRRSRSQKPEVMLGRLAETSFSIPWVE